jgi:hypothetical protein
MSRFIVVSSVACTVVVLAAFNILKSDLQIISTAGTCPIKLNIAVELFFTSSVSDWQNITIRHVLQGYTYLVLVSKVISEYSIGLER